MVFYNKSTVARATTPFDFMVMSSMHFSCAYQSSTDEQSCWEERYNLNKQIKSRLLHHPEQIS